MVVSFPHHIQVIAFGVNIMGSQVTRFQHRSLRSQIWGGHKSVSLQVRAVLLSAAEQHWPTATSELARCLCSYLSCWFLLMQQKAFPSSLYPSNRHDQISVVMKQTENMRHKTEAQMLSFMISFFPSVAQGLWLCRRTFPSLFFLRYPFTFCRAWLCRQKVAVLQVSWYIFTFPEDLFDTACFPKHCHATAGWNVPAGLCLLLPGCKKLVLERVIPCGADIFFFLF